MGTVVEAAARPAVLARLPEEGKAAIRAMTPPPTNTTAAIASAVRRGEREALASFM